MQLNTKGSWHEIRSNRGVAGVPAEHRAWADAQGNVEAQGPDDGRTIMMDVLQQLGDSESILLMYLAD